MNSDLPAGTLLSGRYTVTALLSEAEGERLYRAQASWGEAVLVTEFVGPQEGPEVARARAGYLRQAKLLTQIQHPGVLRTTDLFEERGTVYLVQEDRQWKTLREQMDGGMVPPAAVLALARSLYQALAAVHAGSVRHRRISPERIWLGQDGNPVLARFGLGVAALAEAHVRFTPDARYAAPEQLAPDQQNREDNAGPPGDIYALAAVLAETLTGRSLPPASARSVGVPLPTFPEDTPDALRRALVHALRLNPSERAVSAGEVLEALNRKSQVEVVPTVEVIPEPLADAATPATAPAEPPMPPASPLPPAAPSRRRPPWLIPAAVGVAAVLGLSLAWASIFRGSVPQPPALTQTAAPPTIQANPAPTAEPAAPVPTPDPAPAPVEPVIERVVGTQELLLLDQPDGATLQKLPAGTVLGVVERQEGWVRITGTELAGWVSTEHLLTVHTDAETQTLAATLQAGGEVTVPSGVFVLSEPLTLSSPASITGAGLDQTILISDAAEDTVILKGADFNLSGLTVTHRGTQPARTLVVSGGHLTLSGVRLSGAVRDEAQKAYGSGLWLSDGAVAEVTGSQLTGNAYGLYVSDTSSATVSGSELSRNTDGGGLFMDQSSGTLSQNTIEGNGAHGLHIRGTATPLIQDNQIVRNGQRGLSIFEQAAPSVEKNTIERNGYQGIGVQDQATPSISGNTIRYNRQSGVTYFGQTAGSLQKNTISNNVRAGVAVTQDAAPEVADNTLDRNGENGLAYSDQAGGSASANIIRFSSNPGIAAWGSAHPAVTGNTISQSQQSGVVFAENASGIISGNTIEGNALYGLIITGKATPESSDNTLSGNTKGGIFYKQDAGGSSSGNTCSGNGGPDMQVSLTPGSTGPSLSDDSCSASGY
ncbi:right-handed parallel beta-helix repeat-containing protein [Deinococcus sp.]|uniref:right-handed parallel beta-helix repeat-containing protein n=1 Tax=Deinococcus sp. TaxID=47478 RepID=UPI003C7DE5AE